MTPSTTTPSALDAHADRIHWLSPMLNVHIASFWTAALGFVVPLFFFVAIVLVMATVVLMTRAAWCEAGRSYALRHLALYALLTPVFLVGPIAVPLLVWSDLTKRRAAMAHHAEVVG